jgi:hypothetical protein
MRKRKLRLEADLDPTDTPRTRPGGFAAVRAVEATRAVGKARDKGAASKATIKPRRRGFAALEADLDPPNTQRTRPGGFAAARAVAAIKPKPRSKKR